MIIVSRLLRISPPHADGIIYTKESLESIVASWHDNKDTPVLGFIGDSTPGYMDLADVATKVVNMYVDDEGLIVEQEVLQTPKGDSFKEFLNVLENDPTISAIKFVPYVYSTYDKIGDRAVVVSPAKLHKISIKLSD